MTYISFPVSVTAETVFSAQSKIIGGGADNPAAFILKGITMDNNTIFSYVDHTKLAATSTLDEIRTLGTSEDNAQILGLLIALDEKYRIIMHLHYVEGYKTDELSALLGISSSAVKKRLQRGREALREIYEKEAKQ